MVTCSVLNYEPGVMVTGESHVKRWVFYVELTGAGNEHNYPLTLKRTNCVLIYLLVSNKIIFSLDPTRVILHRRP